MRSINGVRTPVSMAHQVYTPTDLSASVGDFSGAVDFGIFGLKSAAVDVSGLAMWSVFISLTGSAATQITLNLIIMQETDETLELTSIAMTTVLTVALGVQQYTFGFAGSQTPVVPARLVKLQVLGNVAGQNNKVTARLFGRSL